MGGSRFRDMQNFPPAIPNPTVNGGLNKIAMATAQREIKAFSLRCWIFKRYEPRSFGHLHGLNMLLNSCWKRQQQIVTVRRRVDYSKRWRACPASSNLAQRLDFRLRQTSARRVGAFPAAFPRSAAVSKTSRSTFAHQSRLQFSNHFPPSPRCDWSSGHSRRPGARHSCRFIVRIETCTRISFTP